MPALNAISPDKTRESSQNDVQAEAQESVAVKKSENTSGSNDTRLCPDEDAVSKVSVQADPEGHAKRCNARVELPTPKQDADKSKALWSWQATSGVNLRSSGDGSRVGYTLGAQATKNLGDNVSVGFGPKLHMIDLGGRQQVGDPVDVRDNVSAPNLEEATQQRYEKRGPAYVLDVASIRGQTSFGRVSGYVEFSGGIARSGGYESGMSERIVTRDPDKIGKDVSTRDFDVESQRPEVGPSLSGRVGLEYEISDGVSAYGEVGKTDFLGGDRETNQGFFGAGVRVNFNKGKR